MFFLTKTPLNPQLLPIAYCLLPVAYYLLPLKHHFRHRAVSSPQEINAVSKAREVYL